ncbi:MAG: oligosaccharide flippase family protein [Anaerolineales bacterium]|nr:oligosaccharide flippase family protein [Anaerolineales bacterium]
MSEKLIPNKIANLAYSHLMQNSLLLIVSNVSAAILNFSISILVGRELGQAGFGRWAFLLAWAAGLTMICEFGMNSLLTRKISNSSNSLNELLFSTLLIKIFFVTITGLVLWSMSPYLGIDIETSQGLRYVIFIVLNGVMYSSFTAAFRSHGLMVPIVLINISSILFQLLGTFWLLQIQSQILPLIQWVTFIGAVQLSSAFLFWSLHFGRSGGRVTTSIPVCISLLKASVPFAISGIIGAIQMRSSVILLGYIKNESAAGLFGSASRFTEAAKLIPNGIFDAAFPVFAKAGNGMEGQKLLFRQINRVIFLYCIVVVIPLLFLSSYVIKWTFGQAFLPASPILIWLGISLFPTLSNAVIELYLYASGDEKFATWLGFVNVGVQLLASLPLMYFYGAVGAVIGVLLGEIAIWLPLKLRLRSLMS